MSTTRDSRSRMPGVGWKIGNKVRVRIRFRGREIDYVDLALNDLKKVAEVLADISVIEQAPIMEGRSVVMVLAPSKAEEEASVIYIY